MLIDLINTIKDENTIWVMENRDNSDRIFKTQVTDMLFSSTYVIISKDIAYVFVHKLDEGNIHLLDENAKVYVYYNINELYKYIEEVLKKLNFPPKLLLSYTTMSDENTDIITHSSYVRINKIFREIYLKNKKRYRVSSSQNNIYEIMSKNSEIEIDRLRVLSKLTDDVLRLSFESIRDSQTEIDIQNSTIKILKEYMNTNMRKYGIKEYDLAWDNCPIVLVGDNLEKGGHAVPSSTKIRPGDTIYYDFGIKAIYEDEMVLYTDMQRMGYMLKSDEINAPKDVQEVFDTLYDSVSQGIAKMKAGVKGYEVDEIVRGVILNNNYPDYAHATGHPVGKEVHGAGALISTRGSKRGRLELVENGVYTLEPRVNIKNGGSIEEMILVLKDKAEPLSLRQEKIYLI